MSKTKSIAAAKALIGEFQALANKINDSSYSISDTEVQQELSIANQKLEIYRKEFGENAPFYKDVMLLSEKIKVRILENKARECCL